MLIVEVAESSYQFDRDQKASLYARAGVPEYWIVDCSAESIEVYSRPDAGAYRDVNRLAGAASVSPLALPDVALALAEIFA